MTNKYEVGIRRFSMVDDSRAESLGDYKGNRRIAVEIFYPVSKEDVKGLPKAQYVSDNKAAAIVKAFHLPKSALKDNEIDAYENAPMVNEKFPLLMFSHGYNSFMESNSNLLIDIAANGYLIASVGHAYESICNEYDDGTCDYYDKNINKHMYTNGVWKALKGQKKVLKFNGSPEETEAKFRAFTIEHTGFLSERVSVWADDILYALKIVKEKYKDNIDLTNGVAASGHSLGGATAYYLCQTSDEISCGLNIDGALFGSRDDVVMKKPFYQMSCRENWNFESGVFLRKENVAYAAIFDDMKHIGFTDIKFHAPAIIVGKMEPQIMHSHIVESHLFMLDKYLKGKDIAVNKSHDDRVEILER